MAESPSITPLRVFLSYSSEQTNIAEQVYFSLKSSGHDVFFDRTNLRPGEEYNRAILDRIRSSDLFVFLISPSSIQDSAYTRTELRFARDTWPNPEGRVFPVLAMPTDFSQIPNYLKAVTILRPDGNLPAEVSARVNDLAAGRTPQDTIAGKAELIDKMVEATEQLHRSVHVAEIDKQWDIERQRILDSEQSENIKGRRGARVLIVLLMIYPLCYGLGIVLVSPEDFGAITFYILTLSITGLVVFYRTFKMRKAIRMKARVYKEAERQYQSRRLDILSRKQDKSLIFPKDPGTSDEGYGATAPTSTVLVPERPELGHHEGPR